MEDIDITESRDSANNVVWNVRIKKDLPQYAQNNYKITYVLIEGELNEDGTVSKNESVPRKEGYSGQEGYETTYYNGQTSFGNIFDRCYNGQKIIHTLRSTFDFTATKIWKDDGNTVRPSAEVTLWRYPIQDDNSTGIDLSNSARVVVKDKQGKDTI